MEINRASAGYAHRTVLHDVSFQLGPGEFIGLAGPNGSGKTTLLHAITGYHALTTGVINLRGRDISDLSRRAIAAEIAFVPQQTESVYNYSVLEMVLMGRHPFSGLSAIDGPQDVEMAIESLARLDIVHLEKRYFMELSGGEKQLVLLARAFVQRAPILLLDEPLTGLDIRHQYQLMRAVKADTCAAGHAALATFHDLATAARWCTRIILFREGSIVASGLPRDVITPQNLAALYDVKADVSTDVNGQISIQVNDYLRSDAS